jgi:hypothetical protein
MLAELYSAQLIFDQGICKTFLTKEFVKHFDQANLSQKICSNFVNCSLQLYQGICKKNFIKHF